MGLSTRRQTASFIWNRAAGTCAGFAYGIACRRAIATGVVPRAPNIGIIYSIWLIMNVASLIIGLPRYGVGAGNPTLKDSVSRSGNRGATHAEGGGRHKMPVLWALVLRLETYRLRRFRPRPPPILTFRMHGFSKTGLQSCGFHLCGSSSSSLLTEQS